MQWFVCQSSFYECLRSWIIKIFSEIWFIDAANLNLAVTVFTVLNNEVSPSDIILGGKT